MARSVISDMHALSCQSVDRMCEMCEHSQSHLGDLHERQLVHELAFSIQQMSPPLTWLAFEYPYWESSDSRAAARSDILVWRDSVRRQGGRYAWVEVKMTGYKEDGSWDNAFGALRWEEDWKKLHEVDGRLWGAQHERHWAWLYLFQNYQSVREHLVTNGGSTRPCKGWKRLSATEQDEAFWRGRDGKVMTLGNTLRAIRERDWVVQVSAREVVSCRYDGARDVHFALLTTASM